MVKLIYRVSSFFVGFDKDFISRFTCQRSTVTNHKQDCLGNNKEYSFNISKNDNDLAGTLASDSFIQALYNRYDIKDNPPQEGKEVND